MNHGLSGTNIYKRWAGMQWRVSPKNKRGYNFYYGKGIRVCKEWMNVVTFHKWAIQNGYSKDLVIDRIDGNKNYCPENCHWVTPSENSKNKSGKSLKGKDKKSYGKFVRKSNGRFVAEVERDGQCYHVGEYDTEAEAFFQNDLFYRVLIKEK